MATDVLWEKKRLFTDSVSSTMGACKFKKSCSHSCFSYFDLKCSLLHNHASQPGLKPNILLCFRG